MISDTVPEAVQRVILIEEEIILGSDHYRWELSRTIPVEGDQGAIDTHARTLATEYIPRAIHQGCGETVGEVSSGSPNGSWPAEVPDR